MDDQPIKEYFKQPRTLRSMFTFALTQAQLRARMTYLRFVNLLNRAPVTGELDVVVSMTTYGRRIRMVHMTIESVLLGSQKPRRYILWLDDQQAFDNPPRSLRRLVARGLELRMTVNYGPHNKLFPVSCLVAGTSVPVVTGDDDVLYPKGWLEGLVGAYRRYPDVLSGYRVRIIHVIGNTIAPYVSWPFAVDDQPSINNVLTNVSGCIYPPEFVARVCARGTEFLERSPTADDLWLHYVALQAGFQCRQVSDRHLHLEEVPGSQTVNLQNVNVGAGGNDAIVSGLYSEVDISRLANV